MDELNLLMLLIGFGLGAINRAAAEFIIRTFIITKPVRGGGMRLVKREMTAPVRIAPDVRAGEWEVNLFSFALQCTFLDSVSERAVVGAGIVQSANHYRDYAAILRRYGLWYARPRSVTRWLDSRPRVAVGRLRDAIRRGRVSPRYPTPTPPPVFVAFADMHAGKIADRAGVADLQMRND